MTNCPFKFPHETYLPITRYPEIQALMQTADIHARGRDGEFFILRFFGCWFPDIKICRSDRLTTDCYSQKFSMRIEVKTHSVDEPSHTKNHDRDQFNRNISHNSFDVYNMVFIDIAPLSTVQTQSRHSDGILITYINGNDLTIDFMHKFFRDVVAQTTIQRNVTRENNVRYRTIANMLMHIDSLITPPQQVQITNPRLRKYTQKSVLPPLRKDIFEPFYDIANQLCDYGKNKYTIQTYSTIDIPPNSTRVNLTSDDCDEIHNIITDALNMMDEEHGRGRKITADWDAFSAYKGPDDMFWRAREESFFAYLNLLKELRQKYYIEDDIQTDPQSNYARPLIIEPLRQKPNYKRGMRKQYTKQLIITQLPQLNANEANE